uniref:Uncharacterized protein n=1 Tax=Romanomermis culicivorax TaxID=13658 RepID=A0A915JW67_ROMCU
MQDKDQLSEIIDIYKRADRELDNVLILCRLSADCKSRKQPKELNTLLKKKRKLLDKLEKENIEDVKQKYNQCLRDIKQYTYSQKLSTERKILDK